MTRFFTLAAAAMLAACIGTNAWSQGGQGGGGGTSGAGGAGASGSAGAAGSAGTSGAAGTAGTSTAGQAGTTTAGRAGTTTAGQAGTTTAGQGGTAIGTGRQNPSNVPGQRQFGNVPQPGANFNGFNGPNQTSFFTDPGVRQQLNLNDNQFNALNRAHQDAFGRFNQGATALGNNLTEQQRMQQLQQLEARFNQEFGQTLDTTFTDPRLRNRFNQIGTQFRGASAFNDPMVRRQLNLTPAQQRQIRRLEAAWRQRLQQLRRAGNDNPQLTQEQFNELQMQNMQQLSAVLTPEQQQIWAQLTGEPVTFAPQTFFGQPGTAQVPNAQQQVPGAVNPRTAAQQGTLGTQTQGTQGATQGTLDTQTQGTQGTQTQNNQGTLR